MLYFREHSFLVLVTGAEDFGRVMKPFSIFCRDRKILKAIFMEYETLLLDNIWMKSSIKD